MISRTVPSFFAVLRYPAWVGNSIGKMKITNEVSYNSCSCHGSLPSQAVGKPALVDKPHCVCLCIPCRSASDCATMDAMRDLLALARDRGAHKSPAWTLLLMLN